MKLKTLLFLILTTLLVVACGGAAAPTEESAPAEEAPTEEEAPMEEAAAELPTFAMVCSGALGDSGIFDSGNEGLLRAQQDFGIDFKVFEGQQDPSVYYDLLQTAAEQYDVVFVNPGYQFSGELPELTAAYPDTKFVFVDGAAEFEAPNMLSISYKENEGSYAAGVMAAMMTTRTDIEGINPDKVVGVVGALDIPTINNFIAGFRQGIESVDPEVELLVLYAGAFDDPAKGKELALSEFEQGADIVFNVAANTGLGVLEAADEVGRYAIGVDVNQDDYHPGHVMGSMMKRVDNSFYQLVERAVNGEDLEGGVYLYGLAEEGVGMSYSDTMLSIVPEDVVAAMHEADAAVASGEIVVETTK
jgi:basic membrane protein A